jgi:hypothetical protein
MTIRAPAPRLRAARRRAPSSERRSSVPKKPHPVKKDEKEKGVKKEKREI